MSHTQPEHYEVWGIFAAFFKGRTNLMTLKVVNCGWVGQTPNFKRCYEISGGRGFDNQPIYGVTILDIRGGVTVRPDNDLKLSKLCHTFGEAEAYVESLRLVWASYE